MVHVLYFLFVLAVSNYGSGLFNYLFWQKSLVELITSGSAGTWPVLFRNTVNFRLRALFRRFPADSVKNYRFRIQSHQSYEFLVQKQVTFSE